MRLPVFLLAALALSAQPSEMRLIIQADDLGAAHAINVAAIEAFQHGIVRTANVLMPSPWAPEAAALLKQNPGLEAGIHLTLTSEWPTIKWRPLTPAPHLRDPNGYLFPTVPRTGPPLPLDEIETELRAQIELAKKMIPRVTYMHPHMGFANLSPEVTALVARLCKEYGILWAEREVPRKDLGRIWDRADSIDTRIDKFVARLDTLEPGTWFMLEHPATDTPEVQAFGGTVAADRDGIRRMWTSPKVLEAIRRRNIRLLNHRESQ